MVELNEFDSDIVKKILTTGSTIRDAGKIAGNQVYLSQTKNKQAFGVDDFDSVGRAVQGKQRLYFMKNAPFDEMIMKTFNQRLARELNSFYLMSYTLKDINYEENHQIANVKLIIPKANDSADFNEVTISFIDLTEIKYVVSKVEADSNKYRNLFVLPNIYSDGGSDDGDLADILSMDTQQILLQQPTNKFVAITESILDGQKFYETNVPNNRVQHSLSFVKQGGAYNQAIFKDDIDPEDSISDYDVVNQNKEFQFKNNGFYIKNGRITELSNAATSSGVVIDGEDGEEYVGALLDQLGIFYPLATRYFSQRYLPETDVAIDETLDNISTCDSAKDFQKDGDSFINFEANYLISYIKEQTDDTGEEPMDGPASKNEDDLKKMFDEKVSKVN